MRECPFCGGTFKASEASLLAHESCVKRVEEAETMHETKDLFDVSMSSSKLILAIGLTNYEKIVNAGFVLVPKTWRDRACEERWERNKEASQ